MATKAEERKALEQIQKIIDSIGGADSYIGKAFEGCAEIARDNIDNDFWNSMKDQRDVATKKEHEWEEAAAKLKTNWNEALIMAEKAEGMYNIVQGTADSWCAKYHEAKDCATKNWNAFREQEDKVAELQQEIIRLKARLFDMMEAQGA